VPGGGTTRVSGEIGRGAAAVLENRWSGATTGTLVPATAINNGSPQQTPPEPSDVKADSPLPWEDTDAGKEVVAMLSKMNLSSVSIGSRV
jgi:hypothetical protein